MLLFEQVAASVLNVGDDDAKLEEDRISARGFAEKLKRDSALIAAYSGGK